ncbi:MAG: ribosome biogenesis factor YjgA [Desulfobulbaceae bacterium]|nr:ribosome biogenesis factor YjgA [Desulfobulbaceae bacterium]
MDHDISRSEQKRRVKSLEDLATELTHLSANEIKRLPCDDFLKNEILTASGLKSGARKRQLKYITKQIRQADYEPLFVFLAEKKGSKLKQDKTFHELEKLRDDIITEAIEAGREAEGRSERLDVNWDSSLITLAAQKFPGFDQNAAKHAAISYAKSRKPVFNREIFRLLKAAMEHQQVEKQ